MARYACRHSCAGIHPTSGGPRHETLLPKPRSSMQSSPSLGRGALRHLMPCLALVCLAAALPASAQQVYRIVGPDGKVTRSEEHTSELQSLAYLVCRLLLEKKNTNHISMRMLSAGHRSGRVS